jgi:hypothetical protein
MDDYCICSLQEKYIHNSVNCMVTEVQENSLFLNMKLFVKFIFFKTEVSYEHTD